MRPALMLPLLLAFAACASARATSPQPGAMLLAANDNRTPAGTLHGNVLTLHLQIVERDWQPEKALPAWPMLAFAETGKAATSPGPLIRVGKGTTVDLTIDNRTDSDVFIIGLHARPGEEPMLPVAARGSAHARFC